MPTQAERRQRRKEREAALRQRADLELRADAHLARQTQAARDLCRTIGRASVGLPMEPAPEPPSRAALERILGRSAASGRRWDPNAQIELAAPGLITVHEGAGPALRVQDLASDFIFQADTTVTIYHGQQGVVTHVRAGQSWGSVCERGSSRPGSQPRAPVTPEADGTLPVEPEPEELCEAGGASNARGMRALDIATFMDNKASQCQAHGQLRPARLLQQIAGELRRLARAELGNDPLPVEYAIEVAMRNLNLV